MLSSIGRHTVAAALFLSTTPAMAQDNVPAPQLVPDMDNATTIWDNACVACHGELGLGVGGAGPDIRNSKLSLSEIMLVVKAGRNTMPAFAGFTQKELLDVSTYVKESL